MGFITLSSTRSFPAFGFEEYFCWTWNSRLTVTFFSTLKMSFVCCLPLLKPCKCGDCGKALSVRSPLVHHHRTYTREKLYECKECFVLFRVSFLSLGLRIQVYHSCHKCPGTSAHWKRMVWAAAHIWLFCLVLHLLFEGWAAYLFLFFSIFYHFCL